MVASHRNTEGNSVNTFALTGSVAALLLGTSVVLAQAPANERADQPPPSATPAPVPPSGQPSAAGMGPTAMPRMQENMKKMQDLMGRIHASKNSAERQQLLQQHSKAMLEQMETMRGMSGDRGGMMGGGMMMRRMEMMEMMMGQMLQHQEAQQDQKPAK
jgi:hypothetical protein